MYIFINNLCMVNLFPEKHSLRSVTSLLLKAPFINMLKTQVEYFKVKKVF